MNISEKLKLIDLEYEKKLNDEIHDSIGNKMFVGAYFSRSNNVYNLMFYFSWLGEKGSEIKDYGGNITFFLNKESNRYKIRETKKPKADFICNLIDFGGADFADFRVGLHQKVSQNIIDLNDCLSLDNLIDLLIDKSKKDGFDDIIINQIKTDNDIRNYIKSLMLDLFKNDSKMIEFGEINRLENMFIKNNINIANVSQNIKKMKV